MLSFLRLAFFSPRFFKPEHDFEQRTAKRPFLLRRSLPISKSCLPRSSFAFPGRQVVPVGPDWIHETKYDGYRLRLRQGHAANYPQRPPRAFSRSLLTRANWIGSLVFCINALVSMMKIVAV